MYKRSILQRYRRLLCFLSAFVLLSAVLDARPQENVRITLKLDDATLEKAIDAIEQQSPYLFVNMFQMKL